MKNCFRMVSPIRKPPNHTTFCASSKPLEIHRPVGAQISKFCLLGSSGEQGEHQMTVMSYPCHIHPKKPSSLLEKKMVLPQLDYPSSG